MSNRAKWSLIVLLGLMIHMIHVGFAIANLSPYRGTPSIRSMVIPFGQLNYSDATSVAVLELIILFALWVIFAFALIRDKG